MYTRKLCSATFTQFVLLLLLLLFLMYMSWKGVELKGR